MSSAAGLGHIDGDEDYLPPPGPPPGWAAAAPVEAQHAAKLVEAQSAPQTPVETPVGPPPGAQFEGPVEVEIPPSVPVENAPAVPVETTVVPVESPSVPIESPSVPVETPSVPIETPAEMPIETAPEAKTPTEAPIEAEQGLYIEAAPPAPVEAPPAMPVETPEAAPPAPVEEPPAVPVEAPEPEPRKATPVQSEIPVVAHVDTLRALSSETWPTPKPSATSVFMSEPLTASPVPSVPTIPVQAPPSPPTSVPSPKLAPKTGEDNELPSYQESFAAEFDRVINPEIVTTQYVPYSANDYSGVDVGRPSVDSKLDVEVQSNSEKRTVEVRQSVKKKSLAAEQVEAGAEDSPGSFTEGGPSTYSPELYSEPVPAIPEYYAGPSSYPEVIQHDAEEEEEEEEEEEDQEPPPLPPRPTRTEILSKPIAIPALKNSFGSPYIRAYPIELENLGITRETFFTFLDHLNRVTVKSPPLVAVSVVGTTMGFSPEPVTMIVGTVLDLSAQGTNYALSRGRSEVIIRDANRDIFNPVGLHAQVAKLDAVAKIADMPFIDEETGKVASGAQILMPIHELTEIHTLSAQERRIRALDEWLSPLNLEDVPEVEEPKNRFSKMHYKMSERNRRRGEESLMKSRKKARDRHTEAKQKARERYEFELMELARKEHHTRAQAERDEVTREDIEIMIEERKEAARYEYEEDLRRLELKYEKGDKERKGMKKINWLLITEKAVSDAQIDDGGENNPDKVAERAEAAEAGTLA